MVTIIIPAQNEAKYLNRTIQNAFDTATGPIEVLVLDNGGNGTIDKRARVRHFYDNVGEREAMNFAAKKARGEFLLRIDAHCDFSPQGWDVMMSEVTGPKDITVAVLTAVNGEWEDTPKDRQDRWLKQGKATEEWPAWTRIPGHWYGFSYLTINEHGGLEAKWQTPNRDHDQYQPVEPNMGLTGCGFMIRKDFYHEIGGADQDLAKMGAIGEEFAIKAWYHGGKVQTRTDVMIGHIFGTGGYDTSGVKTAQQQLAFRYGSVLPAVKEKFPGWDKVKLQSAAQPGKPGAPDREVQVKRVDEMISKDHDTGRPIRRKTTKHVYVWIAKEHPGEENWTEEQINAKYTDQAVQVSQHIEYIPEEEAMALMGESTP